MMETTTPDEGAVSAQPTPTTEAVKTEATDQIITTDDNGTPSLEPVTSTNDQPSVQAVDDAKTAPETQANGDEDITKFAQAKGYDPAALTDGERKALEMARNAEKKMHEATSKAREFNNAVINQPLVDYTGNETVDALAQQVNQLTIQNKVTSFFDSTPEAREFEGKMAELVTERPHLRNDLDALYALARNDPSREAELKREGGREALTNLAQKQQAVPPSAGATNSQSYETQTITSGNVYDLIDKNDQTWFEKNHAAINKAISGN